MVRNFLIVLMIAAGILAGAALLRRDKLPPLQTQVDTGKELADCLPKSDMASREKCERLLAGIQSFEECKAAGFAIAESYPEQCKTPDGRNFVNQVIIKGKSICLPHKDTSGPITLECAIGMKSENGANFAMDTQGLDPEERFVDTGKNIEVEGTVVAIEAISSDVWRKYDIVGIIKVVKIKIM